MNGLPKYQINALRFLASCGGGFTNATICRESGYGGTRSLMGIFRHSYLVPLAEAGLVEQIDAEKPAVWIITNTGRAALAAERSES